MRGEPDTWTLAMSRSTLRGTGRPHIHIRKIEMGRVHLLDGKIAQVVHRIHIRIVLNVVRDLHIASNGTRLVESREVRDFGRGDAKHDGHGAIRHNLSVPTTRSIYWRFPA